MKYLEKVQDAYRATNEIGVPTPKKIKFSNNRKLSKHKIDSIYKQCLYAFSKFGWLNSSHIYNQCVLVNTTAFKVITTVLKIQAYLTIGYTKINGNPINETTLETLKTELLNPNFESPLPIHVWITLEDGTVIDWTTEASITQHENKVKGIEKCLLHINPEEVTGCEFIPILVGEDYLDKIGFYDAELRNCK